MEDGTIPTENIETNSNKNTSDDVKPDSDTPWSSNPNESKEPEITVTLPEDATITEVALVEPENVDSYTVTVTDSEGNSETVILCVIR